MNIKYLFVQQEKTNGLENHLSGSGLYFFLIINPRLF